MRNNERFWRIAEIVLGALGGALLVTMLVLKLTGNTITALTYPIVGIVILFLICDEFVRSIRRRREKEEAASGTEEQNKPTEPETTLPKDAFEFDGETEEPKQ